MNYVFADEEITARLGSEPFNPPDLSLLSEDDFDNEWWDVHGNLNKLLSTRARSHQSVDDWGDYSLSVSRGESRWIYITFHTKKLWRRDFCEFISEFIMTLPKEYCIGCITEPEGFWGFIRTPSVYLAITKDTAYGSAERMMITKKLEFKSVPRVLRKFGFPRASNRS